MCSIRRLPMRSTASFMESCNRQSAGGSAQEGTLVRFLCDPSHFSAHVTHQEEANGGGGHDHLGYPESHVPAVLLGDSAEGKPRHEGPD